VKDTIAKASPVITITGAAVTYDGKSHAATATAKGVESPTPADLRSLLSLAYKNLATNAVSTSAPVLRGNYAVLATFAGNADYAAIAQFNTGKTISIGNVVPVFANLSGPTITLGASTTILSGKITAPTAVPSGSVTITINGISIVAIIKSGGTFSAPFPTAKLAPGAYTITYSYAGSSTITAGSATSKLTVGLGIKVLFNETLPVKKGSTLTVIFEAEDANGNAVDSTSRTATATTVATVAAPKVLLPLPAGTSPGGIFTTDANHATFTLKLGTTGLSSGHYLLYFTLSGDPVTHAVSFIIAT
jgi:hypothetical protein